MRAGNSAETRRFVSTSLLAFSLLLTALILLRAAMFIGTIVETRVLARQTTIQDQPTSQQIQKQTAGCRAVAEGLKKKNLFTPPAPREHPVKDVSGILGDEAFINNKWYKCRDKIGEATIVHIGPTEVRIEWEGNERTFIPIRSSSPASTGGPKPAVIPEKKENPRQAQMVVTGQSAVPPWWARIPFQDLSTQEQEKLQRLRERWFDMSEQEQQDAMNALHRRFGE